jgi:hypothetical protein
MAALWTLSTAIESLRTRLSDGPTDKYRHQMEVDPTPDGVHRIFGVPESRLVSGTLTVLLDGEPITPDAIDEAAGTFETPAPDEGQQLFASYYFQWFTDDELEEFLLQAAQLLSYEDVEDASIPVGIRTPVISFAAYFAYLRKAAESAPALQASAAGHTSDTSQEHPYWMNLAKMMWESAQQELATATTPPVGAARPAMKFVAYRMARYVPRS